MARVTAGLFVFNTRDDQKVSELFFPLRHFHTEYPHMLASTVENAVAPGYQAQGFVPTSYLILYRHGQMCEVHVLLQMAWRMFCEW